MIVGPPTAGSRPRKKRRLGALDGVLVVDLATERADLAGKVLAELGADVVKIERRGVGAPARLLPPFDESSPNGVSLYWEFVAMGKRSVALDLDDEGDLAQIRELLAGADIFIEAFDPGFLYTYGLDYERVNEFNPGWVYVSVTPFGQTEPNARTPAPEL